MHYNFTKLSQIPQKFIFLSLLFVFSFKALATDYYTASATATLSSNSGVVNANWTTNPNGITGLTTVAVATGDNLVVLNGGTVTITSTATMSITALTINTGGTVIHNNNAAGAQFIINGLLAWNGNIRTLQGVSGSNFFRANGDVTGITAIHDATSNRGIYLGGTGKTINLTQLSTDVMNSNSATVGLLIGTNRALSGNCKLYSPILFSAACTLDLAGFNLQASSIKQGSATNLIKGNINSNLTISGTSATTGTNVTVINFDPAATVLNQLNIDSAYLSTAAGTVTINGDITVNSLIFGTATGDTTIRKLQVNGNFTLANNGILLVRARGARTPRISGTHYDQLAVTGNINIGNSTALRVNLMNSYGGFYESTFDFALSTANTITGSFGTIQYPDGYKGSVSYPSGNTAQCQVYFDYTPNADLPLLPSTVAIEKEITTIIQRFSDAYLGTTEPTIVELNAANASYDALGIAVSRDVISSTVAVTSYLQVTFLKVFAQYLKFHPEDIDDIYTKALNTVWLVSDAVSKETIALDYIQYGYREFATPAVLIPRISENPTVKGLFDYVLFKQNSFDYLWEPRPIQPQNIGYNIDHVGNTGVVTMAYAMWIDSADERFRYMTAFKRQMEKFMEYSGGTYDGIKPDGSTFHHWISYPSYAYNFNSYASIISHLRQTSFQVNKDSYLRLRDALMAQLMFTNDATTRFLTMCGRHPDEIASKISQYDFRDMAVAGGSILGTGASDPAMATLYTRLWGTYAPFNNRTKANFNIGYFQFNHSMAGIYRRDDWLAVCKGFNNNMTGAEIYGRTNPENRFGRYQSYGAVTIVYKGDAVTGNGYDYTTWDWNFNPGTTVIRHTWENLAAERDMQDELQQKRFVGSLSFINRNRSYLTKIQGTYGLFAMDFQERTGNGYSTRYHPENHNATFTFKKSVFTFETMLICLGSDINNNDAANTTLTTLYQRKTTPTTNEVVTVNNTKLETSDYNKTYAATNNHWIVDNFSTGFYVFAGSGTIKLTKADQQTPQEDKLITQQIIANNPVGNYAIGYIDHGLAPSNKGYEYICIPKTTAADMTVLNNKINAGNKPYTVHRKDNMAHIVEYKPSITSTYSIFGYAFFDKLSGINNTGQLTGADSSCLAMAQYDFALKNLKIAVNNPDLGFSARDTIASKSKQINITLKGTNWLITPSNPNATITGTNTLNGETTVQFTLIDGLPVEITLKDNSLSVNKFTEEKEIQLWPNPTSTILNIGKIDETIQIKNVAVFDSLGKLIYSKKEAQSINVTKFTKGIYFLKIETKDGLTINKKFIVN